MGCASFMMENEKALNINKLKLVKYGSSYLDTTIVGIGKHIV